MLEVDPDLTPVNVIENSETPASARGCFRQKQAFANMPKILQLNSRSSNR